MGVGLPDFREEKCKIKLKLDKCSLSQGFEGHFHHFSLNGKNTFHFTILTQNSLADVEIEPESKKQLFLDKF